MGLIGGLLGVSQESQSINPNDQLAISWKPQGWKVQSVTSWKIRNGSGAVAHGWSMGKEHFFSLKERRKMEK